MRTIPLFPFMQHRLLTFNLHVEFIRMNSGLSEPWIDSCTRRVWMGHDFICPTFGFVWGHIGENIIEMSQKRVRARQCLVLVYRNVITTLGPIFSFAGKFDCDIVSFLQHIARRLNRRYDAAEMVENLRCLPVRSRCQNSSRLEPRTRRSAIRHSCQSLVSFT